MKEIKDFIQAIRKNDLASAREVLTQITKNKIEVYKDNIKQNVEIFKK